ncbi:MAG: 16S rRNA (adenine(1518)-N(6)/adenine(1519)-N(6))-dimethyltransferase RsmA [Paludibacteraceae bacterium]|nr:16S rRNA (adenine(1518)-N(6)/adenine(1519)-N(6))-dimethyltransferase RsmA [Paludibacteraceae bacterium]
MHNVRAKKSLGQHFLRDLSVAKRIADTVTAGPVMEIGPGMGVLTGFLLDKEDIDLTAVELDHESVLYLENTLMPNYRFRLIEGDVLKMDWGGMFDGKFSVIGNYPYNISSQIFFKVLDYKDRIDVCSGMLQKEVAERLASKPGNKAYGILSVLLQAWYDIEYLFTVDAQMFNPPPKVQSAVIRMKRNRRRSLECDEVMFKTVVKTSFNQRRKQMRNSLQQIAGKGNPVLEKQIFSMRPEQLSVEEFVELTKLLEKCQN